MSAPASGPGASGAAPLGGPAELAALRRRSHGLLLAAFVFSVAVNLLMLTGPIYMLQVYEGVLGSGSEETLLALSGLVAFLFLMMGILDHLRGRVMARVGARFQAGLDGRVFRAALRRAAASGTGGAPLRDVEAVQRLLASPVFLALFDAPFTPLFLAVIFVFHPLLGLLAMGGGAVLIVLAVLNQALTAGPAARAQADAARAERTAAQLAADAEMVQALGMRAAAQRRWEDARSGGLAEAIAQSDRSGLFTVATKTLRLFLQSAMLGLGAWLVLRGELRAGAMIASSILLGRALAPIEVAIGQWPAVMAALRGRRAVAELLSEVPPEAPRHPLPRPRARLRVEALTVFPPGAAQPALRSFSFRLEPGQALGVIGPSGAGKSSLARALTGAWPPAGGRVRLDAASLDQYDPDALGRLVGYLPQRVTLFEGTIAENVARLDAEADPAAVHRAARLADAHDMIVGQPRGYDTPVAAGGGRLSGGQIQRIGLARALYGDPVLLVLDEPNSNLDNDGTEALNRAIAGHKAKGGAVIIIAHRPAAIRECDLLLMLQDGAVTAFGPREEVLRRTVANHAQIGRRPAAGGVA